MPLSCKNVRLHFILADTKRFCGSCVVSRAQFASIKRAARRHNKTLQQFIQDAIWKKVARHRRALQEQGRATA